MGAVYSYFSTSRRKAQSSGLSPSPTDDTGQKLVGATTEGTDTEVKPAPIAEDKPPEEPESNDTSYGVEATAVRTLAASSGTVAILGTTAKVKEQNDENPDEPQEPAEREMGQCPSISVTEAEPVVPEDDDSNEVVVNVESEEKIEPPDKKEVRDEEPAETKTPDNEKSNEQPHENADISKTPEKELDEAQSPRETEALRELDDSYAENNQNSKENIDDQKTEHIPVATVNDNQQTTEHSKDSLTDKAESLDLDTVEPTVTESKFKEDSMTLAKEPVRIVDYQKKDTFEKIKSQEKQPDDTTEAGEERPKSEILEEKLDPDLESSSKTSSPTKEEVISDDDTKMTNEPKAESPDISKTEDNEISSEQLKTNSLSDMSLSEVMNSEGEEAAREAAKAQELQEMVASLSATANTAPVGFEMSDYAGGNSSFMLQDESTSAQELENIKPLPESPESETELLPEKVESPEKEQETLEQSKKELEKPEDEIKFNKQDIQNEKTQAKEEGDEKKESSEIEQILTEKKVKEAESAPEQPKEHSVIEQEENTDPIKDETEKEVKPGNEPSSLIEEKSTDEDSNSSGLTVNIEPSTPQIRESSSEASEPASNESNDSKQTEVSKLSDKDEVTELGISEDQTIKQKKDESSLQRGKEDDSSSIKAAPTIEELQDKQNSENRNDSNENAINTAATTIQSSFRGFMVRKQMKEGEKAVDAQNEGISSNENSETATEISEIDDAHNSTEINENNQKEEHEKLQSDNSELNTEPGVPEPLMKIAKAEVDRICEEAEKATESLITPPPLVEDSDVRETDQDDSEDFPAPPDDLMESNGKTDETRDDDDSSGRQSTEPTVPLGSNTDGESSKTEHTTAPSLAESEIKSTEPSPSQQIDDYKMESSLTENVNTEVAVNRDSTEGELTMEEDSKEEELGSALQLSKDKGLNENEEDESKDDLKDSKNQDKAATVIQAGYRGFKARKSIKKEPDTAEKSEKQPQDHKISTPEETTTEEQKASGEISPSNETSESETKEESSSISEEELNASAKKIQAGIRGYLVRKDQKVKRDAAVKIQSQYRGFKTRQRLKQESS